MFEYKIEVKPWMLKSASEDFTFMQKFNKDIPMPLMIMYTGGKVDETAKMIKLNLHGDIKQRVITHCMMCGRPITNKVSQYFGIGPICGGHNYTHPFDTEEELNAAVRQYRDKLVNTTWCGWVPFSAIVSIDDITDSKEIKNIVSNMPTEILTDELPISVDNPTEDPNMYVVNVRIDAPEICTDDFSAFITSAYNPELVSAIKNIRSSARAFNPDTKIWEVEYSEFTKLKSQLETSDKYIYVFKITGEDKIPQPVKVSDLSIFKTAPMQHQISGVQFGLDHRRFLLGDEQGLGKSKEVIDLAVIRKNTFGFKHCLIICGVNSLKWNWLEEIEKHSNETGWILGQRMMPRRKRLTVKGNAEKLADLNALGTGSEIDNAYFLITNIESIRNSAISDKLTELCNNREIAMVAIDEAHRVRNLNTQTGQNVLKIQPEYRVAMTGTPLINTPLDLYALLKWLGYQRYEFKQFKYHFCQFNDWGEIVGYKNIDQLTDQLSAIMIRRKKEDVLDLPDKVYINDYVELNPEQKKLYNQVIDDAVEDSELADKISTDCLLALKTRLRQISGGIAPFDFIKTNPKLDRLDQLVEEAVYSGTKVIVYSNWVQGINPAVKRLQKYNPVVITGETKDSDRQAIVNRFQNDSSVKVIFGTIGALGTGLTLTAANEVIFLDEPWTNAAKEQAIDRCHRIGTTSSVIIHTIMSHSTYDEEVHDIVLGKRDLADTIVDKDTIRSWKIA